MTHLVPSFGSDLAAPALGAIASVAFPVLAKMQLMQWLLALALIVVSVFLIGVVLIQKGRGEGLAGALGGGGGGGAFGAKTGDVFTVITVVFAFVFVLLAVVSNFAFDAAPEPPAPLQATTTGDGTTDTTTDQGDELPPPVSAGGLSTDEAPAEDAPSGEGAEGAEQGTADAPAPTGDTGAAPANTEGDGGEQAAGGETAEPAKTGEEGDGGR